MNLYELKQKLNQERYYIEHPDRIIVPGARQRTDVVRNGFNLSNRFRLSDKLSLTLAADYQRETLEERTDIANSADLMNTFGVLTRMAALGGPQSAKKREWGANLVFDWKPTSRLNIQAGVRYQNFKGRNIELAQQRAARNPWYQYGLGSNSYVTGLMMPYYELADEEDLRLLDGLRRTYNPNFWDQMDRQSDEYKQLNRRFAHVVLLSCGRKKRRLFFRRPLLRGMMESSPMRTEGMRLICRNRKGVCLNDRAAKFD